MFPMEGVPLEKGRIFAERRSALASYTGKSIGYSSMSGLRRLTRTLSGLFPRGSAPWPR